MPASRRSPAASGAGSTSPSAIVGDPELLFLDEPTTGFDPSARRRSWELIDGLRALDKTILLTTHYMEEAQQLADRVAVIASGRVVAEGPPATLAGREHGSRSRPSAYHTRSPWTSCPPGRGRPRAGQRARQLPHRGRQPRPRAPRSPGRGERTASSRGYGHAAVPRGRLPRAHRAEGVVMARRPCACGSAVAATLDRRRA